MEKRRVFRLNFSPFSLPVIFDAASVKIDCIKEADLISPEILLIKETPCCTTVKGSESFVFDNPPEQEAKNLSKLDSQPSRVQNAPSRPGSSQKVSKSSIAGAKLHGMDLPHPLGAKPSYMKKQQAKKQSTNEGTSVDLDSLLRTKSFVTETKTSKGRQMNSQSSAVFSRPSTAKPSEASLKQPLNTNNFHAKNLPAMYKKSVIKDAENSELKRSVSTAPADPTGKGEPEVRDLEQLDYWKNQAKTYSAKALESSKRAAESAKTVEQLRQKMAELEKLFEEKNNEVNLKNERIKSMGFKMKNQREKSDKISTVETQLTESKKLSADLQKELEKKEEIFQKLKSDIQRMKRELEVKIKSCESMQTEKKYMEQLLKTAKQDKVSGDEGHQQKMELERKLQDLELQLQTYKADFLKLQEESNILASENVGFFFENLSLNMLYVVFFTFLGIHESSKPERLKRRQSGNKESYAGTVGA